MLFTSVYCGPPESHRHSSSSSLLKERSEVVARMCRPALRISHASCTAAPVTLRTRGQRESKEVCARTYTISEHSSWFLSYLMWEWAHALAKLPLRFWKSLSLNMLSLKNASSRKNNFDTSANEESPSGPGGGSCSKRVRVTPPRERRSNESGFIGSDWPSRDDRSIGKENKNTVDGLQDEKLMECRHTQRVCLKQV